MFANGVEQGIQAQRVCADRRVCVQQGFQVDDRLVGQVRLGEDSRRGFGKPEAGPLSGSGRPLGVLRRIRAPAQAGVYVAQAGDQALVIRTVGDEPFQRYPGRVEGGASRGFISAEAVRPRRIKRLGKVDDLGLEYR